MKLTALIPAHNDEYTLRFCLDSVLPVFDEVVVLDDCSDDSTPELLWCYKARWKKLKVITNDSKQQHGWWRSRNRLLGATENDRVFFLDSDDVLVEYNARVLAQIAAGDRPLVRLKLFELWGDFEHGTRHRTKTDNCHLFVNRAVVDDAEWGRSGSYGGTSAGLKQTKAPMSPHDGGVLFFHIKGCKSDRRLYERQQIRPWIREGMKGRLVEWANLATVPKEVMHQRALVMLLQSKQDPIKKLYPGGDVPQRPKVICEAEPRFKIVYENGVPVDRTDAWEGR